MKGKKADMSQSTIISLVVLLITVLIIFTYFENITSLLKGAADGGTCGISVAMASMKADPLCVADVKSPTALACPRRNIEIGVQETQISFKGKKEKIDVGSSSLQEMEKLFADELINCWKKFGSGQTAVFPERAGNIVTGKSKISCHICSEIHFNQQDYEEAGVIPTNISRYLENTVYEDDKTYIDILNNPKAYCQEDFRGGEGCWSEFEKGVTRSDLNGRNVEALGNQVPNTVNYGETDREEARRVAAETESTETQISRITSLDPTQTYAVVMVRRGYELCADGRELTTFAYIIPQNELGDFCGMIIT